MRVKDVMSSKLYYCLPTDTAQSAAKMMKLHGVGALPVVSDSANRTLEGIVTDRDLCCEVVASAKLAAMIKISDVMTRNPIVCGTEDTIDECERLMQKHQIRRLPITDKQGRCIGMIAQADAALHSSAAKTAKMLAGISKPAKEHRRVHAAVA